MTTVAKARASSKGAVITHPYAVPSCVIDEESVERHFHRDLPGLDDAVLAHELRLAEAALANIPKAFRIDREWWAGRRAAVLAERQRRRTTVPDPSGGSPRSITVEVE